MMTEPEQTAAVDETPAEDSQPAEDSPAADVDEDTADSAGDGDD